LRFRFLVLVFRRDLFIAISRVVLDSSSFQLIARAKILVVL
jgi:hypothetical protein